MLASAWSSVMYKDKWGPYILHQGYPSCIPHPTWATCGTSSGYTHPERAPEDTALPNTHTKSEVLSRWLYGAGRPAPHTDRPSGQPFSMSCPWPPLQHLYSHSLSLHHRQSGQEAPSLSSPESITLKEHRRDEKESRLSQPRAWTPWKVLGSLNTPPKKAL